MDRHGALRSDLLDRGGIELAASVDVLGIGAISGPTLGRHLPTTARGGVDRAPTGVIQDPAGAAIGIGTPPAAAAVGGASRAIYDAVTDLHPIPQLAPGRSIMNTAPGPGRRVLHTHSPRLRGSPSNLADCAAALQSLADAYLEAIEVASQAETLNLVPLAGRIFAGSFLDPSLDHLHPSYTVAAILGALARTIGRGTIPPPLVLWVHEAAVFEETNEVLDQWRSELGSTTDSIRS